jgi:acetyltransferase EpsM
MAPVGPAAQAADPPVRVTARPLVIVGGGEHARVVADAARCWPERWALVGFTDRAADPDSAARLGLEHLGDDEAILARLHAADSRDAAPWLVLGIGDIATRRSAAERLSRARWATIVHPAASISPSARVAEGAVVLAGAVVNPGAEIGAHAIVNSGAIVEHDVVVGAFAHLAPGAVVGGGARIGAGAFVGLGCAVRDHVEIGDDAIVGMGAVVVAAVPAGTTVVGVPARPMGSR